MANERKKSGGQKKSKAAAKVAPDLLEQRILILAPIGNDAALTAQFLGKENLSAHICRDVQNLCAEVAKGCGAILLAEETLAQSSISILVETLGAQPPWSDIPIILITSGGEISQSRLRRLTSFAPGGNVTLLERPFRPVTLISVAEVALRSRKRQYEARQLMKELQVVGERLQVATNAADIGAFEWNIQANTNYWTPELERLYGLPPGGFNGHNAHDWSKYLHPDDFKEAMALALRAVEQRTDFIAEFRIIWPDGTVRWLAGRAQVICDAAGEPLRMIGINIDITERKQAEIAARESNQRFRLITEIVEMQVWTAKPTGELDFANQECVKYLAADLQRDILGNAWAQFVHPDDLPEALKRWQKSLASGERYEVEFRLRSKSGEFRWFLIRARASYDTEGRIVKWFGTNTDIHAVKMAQQEAARASHAKDDFLAALSHELRTPLNPALLIASESADNKELPEPVRLNFEIIRKNIELEARLIDDLLDLTRITTGKIVLNKSGVDVHDILTDAIATTQAEQQEKKLHLDIRLNAAQCWVEGDAVRLQQVFWNVLKNAVKFTPVKGKITLETSINEKSQLLIKITDTGIGMNANEVSRVFTAFAQGDHAGDGGSHRFGGLGLGLAISKNLVELHSGKITAHSEGKGCGSTFTIELPLAKKSSAVRNGKILSDDKDALAATGKNGAAQICVLLVEDHEVTRNVLLQLLTRRNYKVITAASIAQARKLAQQNKFDLLISDIGLPDGNGNELMKEFHASYGLKGIALTGYGMEEDIVRGKAAGFVTHLIKPVRIESLEHALETVKNTE